MPLDPVFAVHDVAFVVLQVMVDDCPEVIDVGEAVRVRVGAVVVVIVTVTDCVAVPPAPVHERV